MWKHTDLHLGQWIMRLFWRNGDNDFEAAPSRHAQVVFR
jgi:hypothetical protein